MKERVKKEQMESPKKLREYYKKLEKEMGVYLKEEEKEFRYDVTIGFKVKAKDKETAKAIIEEEIEFINPRLVTDEIWYFVSKEVSK